MKKQLAGLIGIMALASKCAFASIVVPIYLTDANGQGKSIGTVKMAQEHCGVLFVPDLHGLPPGVHGFHIHEKSSCAEQGMAAGGHLDPKQTGKHEGPYSEKGHLGDLPPLIVDENKQAVLPVLAPRLKLSQLKDHTLMIHAGGDNYSDQPEKLGGGGKRIACGVINLK